MYDTAGNLLKETSYYYLHYDSAKQQYDYSSTPEIIVSKLEFDSLGRTFTKTKINSKGVKVFQMVMSYNPLSERAVWHNEDGSVHDVTTIFEAQWVEKKVVEVYRSGKGETDSVEYLFKNKFDKSGRIKSRKIERVTPDTPVKSRNYYFKDYSYKYSLSGLLIEKSYRNTSDKSDWEMEQVFDYKFWEAQ